MKKGKSKYDIHFLEPIVKESFNISEVLRKLKLPRNGASWNYIKGKIQELNIDTSHFTGQHHFGERNPKRIRKIPISDLLVENVTYSNNYFLKKRIIEEKIIPYVCKFCGLIDKWYGKILRLELDHINGIHNDYRIENIRFLCPNCHSQTETYSRIKKKIKIL